MPASKLKRPPKEKTSKLTISLPEALWIRVRTSQISSRLKARDFYRNVFESHPMLQDKGAEVA